MIRTDLAIWAVFLLGCFAILFIFCLCEWSKRIWPRKTFSQENSAEANPPQEENEDLLGNNIPGIPLDTNSSDIICNQFNLPSYEDALKM